MNKVFFFILLSFKIDLPMFPTDLASSPAFFKISVINLTVVDFPFVHVTVIILFPKLLA